MGLLEYYDRQELPLERSILVFNFLTKMGPRLFYKQSTVNMFNKSCQ